MNKFLLHFLFLFILFFSSSFGWGAMGHESIAEVAFDLLSESDQNVIKHYLGNMTLAEVAPQPDPYVEKNTLF